MNFAISQALQAFSRTPSNINGCLTTLEQAIKTTTLSTAHTTELVLNASPGIFELVITSPGPDAIEDLRSQLVTTLESPSGAVSSVHQRVLERVGHLLMRVPPWIELDRRLTAIFAKATQILEGINDLSSTQEISSLQDLRLLDGDDDTALAGSVAIEDIPSEDRNFGTLFLKKTLQAYFRMGRHPDIHGFVRQTYFALEAPESRMQQTQDFAEPSVPPQNDGISEVIPSSEGVTKKAIVRPRWYSSKDADGYGAWRVVIAQRAIKHFRELQSRDANISAIIDRKLKELSGGIFSTTNHLELLEEDNGVTLYQARVVNNLRLIYHIDCGIERHGYPETQYIRVYGLYSINHIDKRFWTSVASQLSQRGRSYRRKCRARAVPRSKTKGVNVIPPITFSADSEENRDDVDLVRPGKPVRDEGKPETEDYFLELHRILALEKFVPFSREFFATIRNHSESTLAFTVSPQEDEVINHDSSCLVLGRSGTGKTTVMIFRLMSVEIASDHTEERYRQMFITQSPTLVKRVRAYYSQLRSSTSQQAGDIENPYQTFITLQDSDIHSDNFSHLPERFTQLKDTHFPLFITFDKLCQMLALDFGLEYYRTEPASSHLRGTGSDQHSKGPRYPLVTFDMFVADLWSHFPENLTKGLDAALVFNEIMGVIKGSEAAITTSKGFISRNAYVDENQTTSTIPEEADRKRIYDLFELYRKRRSGHSWDLPDRMFELVNKMKNLRKVGQYVDYLYVDEAQDNLIGDTALLHRLCTNPNGLFFAGDTAQTISVGCAFKFTELKANFYRLERSDSLVASGRRQPVDPKFFQLPINYRSHQGIVNAAAYLVSLLLQQFPRSIDALAPESAIVAGPKPLFLSGRATEDDFLALISDKTGKPTLGAHQAILVRNEATAERLRTTTGRAGIVLTIYDSKGMEFNDVILYDFFSDSHASSSNWRALVNADEHGQTFDDRRHAILQSELKTLYVAMTRAREHVYIWDSLAENLPLEDRMSGLGLISVHDISKAAPHIGAVSLPEEWRNQGRAFFDRRQFSEAAFCFDRGALPWWRDTSLAYAERTAANRIASQQVAMRSAAFVNVASKFEALASETMIHADRKLLLLDAAHCYREARRWVSAAHNFRLCGEFNDAAWYYRIAGKFDDAVAVIKHHEATMKPDTVEAVKYAAKIEYTKGKQLEKARALCTDDADYGDFLDDHAFDGQRVEFLESRRSYEDLGRVHWQNGHHALAVQQFLLSKKVDVRSLAKDCWLEGFWKRAGFGFNASRFHVEIKDLLPSLPGLPLSRHERDEVDFMRKLESLPIATVETRARLWGEGGNVRSALIAYNFWSTANPPRQLERLNAEPATALLHSYFAYCRFLSRCASKLDITTDVSLQWCFGVYPISKEIPEARQDGRFVLTDNSPLRPVVAKLQKEGDSVTLSAHSVNSYLQRFLLDRLDNLLLDLDRNALKCRAFEPCPWYLALGECAGLPGDPKGCSRDHPASDGASIGAFNQRIRLHLLLMAILDLYTATTGGRTSRTSIQGIWLARFFETCFPQFSRLGGISDICPDLIPEFDDTIRVVLDWCQEVYLRQRPKSDYPQFFLSNILASSMLSTCIDYERTTQYMWGGLWREDPDTAAQAKLINDQQDPVVKSILKWYAKRNVNRASPGYFFIRHLVFEVPAVDILVLVSLAEDYCGQLIYNHYHHSDAGFNGMTMPRAWVVKALHRGHSPQKNLHFIPGNFLDVMIHFLDILLDDKKDAGRLHIRGHRLTKFDSGYDRLSIAVTVFRVCRTITIMGCNWKDLHDKIVGSFRQRLFSRQSHQSIYRRFFTVNKWSDVEDAILQSGSNAGLDEMVALQCDFNRPPPQVKGIRSIRCPKDSEMLKRVTLGAHALLLSPPETRPQPVAAKAKRNRRKLKKQEADDEGAEEDAGYGPKHEDAAKVLQRLFRRTRPRHGGAGARALEEFASALAPLAKSYRFAIYVRGPLPHVIAHIRQLLDLCKALVIRYNTRIRSVQSTEHKKLEEFRDKRTRTRIIKTELDQHLKDLVSVADPRKPEAPPPDFYKKAAERWEIIPEKALSIHRLVDSLCEFEQNLYGDDYALGIGAIVRHKTRADSLKKPGKKLAKPGLNIDDL